MNAFELRSKLTLFQKLINEAQELLAYSHLEPKYKIAKQAYIKKAKEVDYLIDSDELIPKSYTTKMLVLHNIMINSIGKTERAYRKILKQLKEQGVELRDYFKNTRNVKLEEKYNKLMSQYVTIKENGEKILETSINDSNLNYFLLNNAPISKSEFLEVFPLTKDKPDSCTRLNFQGSNKAISELPELIDGDAYRSFMAGNCVLIADVHVSGFYSDECYRRLKQSGVDIFQALQEIAGKPIPSYTVKFDEFDNAVSIEENRPKLTLVK
ncbi:hypothetical protein [Brevibacillus sp. NRS-1366]|uniref:hypothetical protein n=1 Tax=Brevibacillus sp. NRS-1366 TaxID=3233899 RepID=UPI003D20290B